MIKEAPDTIAKKNSYRNFLLNVRNLPSIPVIMYEVTKLLSSPNTSASDLGKLISKDQGLVAKILTVANSPLYGLPRRVSTIEFAIVILGFDHIKNIVVALSMIEAFKNHRSKRWDSKNYWEHSLLTASAAKRIADDLGYPKSSEVFTAGLLHDLGISIIQRYFFPEFNAICDMVEEQQIRYLNAEEKVLGLTHQEIGQMLATIWNLPQSLGDVIAHHHQPSRSEQNKVIASIIHLADYMTQRLQVGNFNWDENMELDMNILKILRFKDEEHFNQFIESYDELFRIHSESIVL